MNILLDTNIIIPLEDTSRILDSSFAELRKLSAEQQHCLYIHPIQFEDIKRDKNLERQKIVLSRLRIADNTLVALTLMIAESRTEEKDVMVKVVVNLINQRN